MKTLLACLCLAAAFTFQGHCAPSDYSSSEKIPSEKQFIERIWENKGTVVIGRLEMPQGVKVLARTPINKDGSFCTALYPGRVVVFMAHGYAPLEVNPGSAPDVFEPEPNVFDAGVLKLSPSQPGDLRSVRALVNSTTDPATPITATLSIRNPKSLLKDDGYRGGQIALNVATQKIASGQPVRFEGLSRLPYSLTLLGQGCIVQVIPIDPAQSGEIDLGTLSLQRAKAYEITYRARIRQKGGPWLTDEKPKTAQLSCDGTASLKFTDQRDGLRNRLDLRVLPKGEQTEVSFFFHRSNSFFELNPSVALDSPEFPTVDTTALKGSSKTFLHDNGHYLFRVEDIHGTDIEVFFQARQL